jgi:TctA family transporter
VFVQRPLSLTFLVLAAVLLLIVLAPGVRRNREVAFQE